MNASLALLLFLPVLPGPQQAARPLPSRTTAAPVVVATGCASSIRDQANPGACIEASTVPVLGKILPLSQALFVSSSGNVGVGTTSPAEKLDVAGTVRMTDTLTLEPDDDRALDVKAGSIYKGGALFIHTKGGPFTPENLAVGRSALASVTTGFANTAVGTRALQFSTSGDGNTACGSRAAEANSGKFNTAIGASALSSNTGSYNTAIGFGALPVGAGNYNI